MSNKTLVALGVGILALIALFIAASHRGAFGENEPQNQPSEAAVSEFTQATQNQVIARGGHPIEGFEPSMFLAVYPGLEEEDFNGVEAAIGVYVYENGELAHDLQGEEQVHSAAQAITDEGMATLLENVSSRLGIDVESEGGVDAVLAEIEGDVEAEGTVTPSTEDEPLQGAENPDESISSSNDGEGEVPPAVVPGEPVTLEGEVVCLPHKDTSGPQTMECAYGLRTDDGTHYGLKNLFKVASIGEIDTGSRVRVTGSLDDPEEGNRYAIEGVIDIATIISL